MKAGENLKVQMERNVMMVEPAEIGEYFASPTPPPPPSSIDHNTASLFSNGGTLPDYEVKNITDGLGPKPLIIIDGKIVDCDINKIDPKTINWMQVTTNKSAIDKYGDRGKDGVIEIYSKKEVAPPPPPAEFKIDGIGKSPLIVIDGTISKKTEMDNMDPNTIEKIEVLKDESAIKLYGDKAKDGVIMITTKKNIAPPPPPCDTVFNVKGNGGKQLIVIDGVIETDINKIGNPETIESINVLKGKDAIEKYGHKGKNGVIEITTKNLQREITQHLKANTNQAVSKEDTPSNGVAGEKKNFSEQFVAVEEIPQFVGGKKALEYFLQTATANSKEKGVVRVYFTVQADGDIDKIKIDDSVSKYLQEQAWKVMKSMPSWIPGKQNGKNVKVDMEINLLF